MLVVASGNGEAGMTAAMEILRSGGSALDAVEAGIRIIESDLAESSVGIGGLPNVVGEVELDASIMDGRTLAAGSVGALAGFEHPISVARRVMELSPHAFLVAGGAARFATETGFSPRQLLTPASRKIWQRGLPDALSTQDRRELRYRGELLPMVRQAVERTSQHGTVNFIARDGKGNLACGVSTSGWPWKYPGRLGDSPVIGAGNYADNRYGAAACTGYGELAIRCGTAHSVVLFMRMAKSIRAACRGAIHDLAPLLATHGGVVNVVAVDREGRPFGVSSSLKPAHYWVMSEASTVPEKRALQVVSA